MPDTTQQSKEAMEVAKALVLQAGAYVDADNDRRIDCSADMLEAHIARALDAFASQRVREATGELLKLVESGMSITPFFQEHAEWVKRAKSVLAAIAEGKK